MWLELVPANQQLTPPSSPCIVISLWFEKSSTLSCTVCATLIKCEVSAASWEILFALYDVKDQTWCSWKHLRESRFWKEDWYHRISGILVLAVFLLGRGLHPPINLSNKKHFWGYQTSMYDNLYLHGFEDSEAVSKRETHGSVCTMVFACRWAPCSECLVALYKYQSTHTYTKVAEDMQHLDIAVLSGQRNKTCVFCECVSVTPAHFLHEMHSLFLGSCV